MKNSEREQTLPPNYAFLRYNLSWFLLRNKSPKKNILLPFLPKRNLETGPVPERETVQITMIV